jgi:hypothetical protein
MLKMSTKLLNEENYDRCNGLLVVEIIPIPKEQGSSIIEIPEVGKRVKVVGVWVRDGGWNEIHPSSMESGGFKLEYTFPTFAK